MKQSRLFLLAWLAALAMAVPARAAQREETFEECAITLSESWERFEPANVPDVVAETGVKVAYYRRQDPPAVATIIVNQNERMKVELNDNYLREFERGLVKSGGGERTSWQYVKVAGIKSYERIGKLNIESAASPITLRMIPTAQGMYVVQVTRPGGGTADDSEARQIVESFRFLKPPKVSPMTDPAYRAGYVIGAVVFAGGVVIVVIGIIVAISYALGRKKPLRAGPPPPLPPSLPS